MFAAMATGEIWSEFGPSSANQRGDGSFLSIFFHFGNNKLLASRSGVVCSTDRCPDGGPRLMNKSHEMALPEKLVMISDSVLLDQRQAQRTAYLGMIDRIAEQSGVASALVAQAIQHPTVAPATGDDASSEHPEAARLYATAKDAVAFYLTKRTEATRPPDGLGDALRTIRNNLSAHPNSGSVTMVGVSALPPAALHSYLGQTELRPALDVVYCLGRSAVDEGLPQARAVDAGWIRQLPGRLAWPSPTVMKAICAIHHVRPGESTMIGGNLGEEVGPALALGMKAVYVRLGMLDTAASEVENPSPAFPTSARRPDGIVTRTQDLPRLALFRGPDVDGPSPLHRPPQAIDRDR
jgi:hypothetical protein